MIIVNSFTVQQPIKTDYRIYEEGKKPLITVVTKNNQPHPDFTAALLPVFQMIYRFCGFDFLTQKIIKKTAVTAEAVMAISEWERLITIDKLIFPHSDKKGDGIKISFWFSTPFSENAGIKITTPVIWEGNLEPNELAIIAIMKKEAYLYAHEDKQAQTELNFDDDSDNYGSGNIEPDVFKPISEEEKASAPIPFKKTRKKKQETKPSA